MPESKYPWLIPARKAIAYNLRPYSRSNRRRRGSRTVRAIAGTLAFAATLLFHQCGHTVLSRNPRESSAPSGRLAAGDLAQMRMEAAAQISFGLTPRTTRDLLPLDRLLKHGVRSLPVFGRHGLR